MTTAPVMTITQELLDELDLLAEATDGWYSEHWSDMALHAEEDAAFVRKASPATVRALIAHIRSLEARLEEAEKDAARYQWLRGNGTFAPSAWGNGWALACGSSRYSSVELDASVDAAIAQEGKSNE